MSETSFSSHPLGAAIASPVRAGRGKLGRRCLRRAGDRARPELERETQHRHDRRGRPGRFQPGRRRLREHRGLCDVYEPAIDRAAVHHPQARRVTRFPQALRPRPRVRRGGREHHRAHPRLRHLAGLATGQARLLREAADLQHLGGPRHSRGGRQGQGRHPDGHADSRRRQLPPRRGADPDRRHRAGA